jgi:hypothetical protein
MIHGTSVPLIIQHMKQWIDFRELREKLDCEALLKLYNVEVMRRGQQHQGPCPLPGHRGQGSSPAFSVNLVRGIFKCFGCHEQGNLLDFAVLMEGKDPKNGAEVRTVARKLADHFGIGARPEPRSKPSIEPTAPTAASMREERVNHPLDFELKGLVTDHPWFENHGIGPETVKHFGLGVAQRGSLKGRLAVPIHDGSGKLLGYASSTIEAATGCFGSIPWEFPPERDHEGVRYRFDPDVVAYNLHRRSMTYERNVLTSSLEIVWWLYEQRVRDAIALLGDRSSPSSRHPLLDSIGDLNNQVFVSIDDGRDHKPESEFVATLAKAGWVRWLTIDPQEGISADELRLLGVS